MAASKGSTGDTKNSDKFKVGDRVFVDDLHGLDAPSAATIRGPRRWAPYTKTTSRYVYDVELDEPIGVFSPHVVQEEETLRLMPQSDPAFQRFLAAALTKPRKGRVRHG